MEIQVRYLALFCLFSVIDGFEWFWMGSSHKNIQNMLEFLIVPFLVFYFSYCTLMTFFSYSALITFLMILFVILLSMLMILLSTLNVIRHLICGSNQKLLLNLNLIYETLGRGRKWLVNFNDGKTRLVFLTVLITLVLLL